MVKNKISSENKVQNNKAGLKISRYTHEQKGNKIPNEMIIGHFCELIAEDGYANGYKNSLLTGDVKYSYIIDTMQFFFQLSVIDVFNRVIVDYHIDLSVTAKDASRI